MFRKFLPERPEVTIERADGQLRLENDSFAFISREKNNHEKLHQKLPFRFTLPLPVRGWRTNRSGRASPDVLNFTRFSAASSSPEETDKNRTAGLLWAVPGSKRVNSLATANAALARTVGTKCNFHPELTANAKVFGVKFTKVPIKWS